MLMMVAGVSVFLSVAASTVRFFPKGAGPESFAGLLGLAALVCWIAMVMIAPRRQIVIVGWWVLLALYLLACVVAAVGR
jgi:hypothetical protein